MPEDTLPSDSDILVGLYPEQAKTIHQVSVLRGRSRGERPIQRASTRANSPYAAPMPSFTDVQGGASSVQPEQPDNGPTSHTPATTPRGGLPRTMASVSAATGGAPDAGGAMQPQPGLMNTPAAAPAAPGGTPADIYKRADEVRQRAYNVAPDPEEMQRQMRGADDSFFSGAVMQALGGRAFAPMGGQVLQQALKRRGELELDPEKELQRRVRSLEGEAQALERQAALAQNAIDKKQLQDDALAARAEQARLQREMIQANKQIAYAQAAATRDAARENRQAAQSFQQENMLRDDFEKQVKDQRLTLAVFPQIEAALTAKVPSAAGDMRAIFRYMKMLDPTSVVREGEYATAQNAASIPAQVRNLYNRAAKGLILAPEQRADFLKQAMSERDIAMTFFNDRASQFSTRARGYGLNPSNVVIGYGDGPTDEPPANAVRERGRTPTDNPRQRATDEPPAGAVRPR